MPYKDPENKKKADRDYHLAHRDERVGYSRSYFQENKTALMAANRQYLKDHPEAAKLYYKRYQLKKKFGISLDEYNELLKSQDGRCAICRRTPEEINPNKPKFLAVDHDHLTGKLRGLLCYGCNIALGHLGDCVDGLRLALEYLQKFELNLGRQECPK